MSRWGRGPSAHYNEEKLGKAVDARLIGRLWTYVKPYRGLLALAFGLLLIVSAAQLAQPYLLKLAIDRYMTQGTTDGLGRLALAAAQTRPRPTSPLCVCAL